MKRVEIKKPRCPLGRTDLSSSRLVSCLGHYLSSAFLVLPVFSANMSTPSLRLARMELFKQSSRALSDDEAIALGYEQARASAKEYGKTGMGLFDSKLN